VAVKHFNAISISSVQLITREAKFLNDVTLLEASTTPTRHRFGWQRKLKLLLVSKLLSVHTAVGTFWLKLRSHRIRRRAAPCGILRRFHHNVQQDRNRAQIVHVDRVAWRDNK